MTLSFNITYKGKQHPAIIQLPSYTGPIPQLDSIVDFQGSERQVLEALRLPHGFWRVSQVVHDIEGGAMTLVTVSLEIRSAKRERDTSGRGTMSAATI